LSGLPFLLIITDAAGNQYQHRAVAVPIASCPRLEGYVIRLGKIKHFIVSNHRRQVRLSGKRTGKIYRVAERKRKWISVIPAARRTSGDNSTGGRTAK
jgi:hypothetical protein